MKTNKKLKQKIKKNTTLGKKSTLKKQKKDTKLAKPKILKSNGSLDKVSTQNINIKTDITAPADEKTESPK